MNSNYFSANYSQNKCNISRLLALAHQYYHFSLCIVCSALSFFTLPAFAVDYYQEQQVSLDLQKQYPADDITWLPDVNNLKTLALNYPALHTQQLGAVILLSDINQRPDSPGITHALQQTLARHGWHVLSVQMPYSTGTQSADALSDLQSSISTRLKAAIDHVSTNYKNIVIVAQRHSANIAIKTLSNETEYQKKISAIVGISLFDSSGTQTSLYMRQLNLPLLDVFAQNDTRDVTSSAKDRLIAARFTANDKNNSLHSPKVTALAINKSGNIQYRQSIINGAYEQFTNHTEILTKVIRGWLKKHESK